MTVLIASIAADHAAAVRHGAERAWRDGADAVELRIDHFAGDPRSLAEYLRAHRDRMWIVTCRSAAEGGGSQDDAATRAVLVASATEGADVFVDFEAADWEREPEVRKTLRRFVDAGRLVLSSHHFDLRPDDLSIIVERALGTGGVAAAKVAYRAESISDSFAALDIMHAHGRSVTALPMGEAGAWARVLAGKLGGFSSYAALSPDTATAPGQWTLADMIGRFRWRTLDSATRIYGVIGDPVAHSKGPDLFNRWFAEAGINAVYLPMPVRAGELDRFLSECVQRPWLDVGGFSVTIPHKSDIVRWAGDGADWLSRSLEAANTVVLGADKARVYNADSHAAVDSLVDALGGAPTDLFRMPVDVLGTGGAARAVIAGLRYYGADVTAYGRSPDRLRSLADRFDCAMKPWDQRHHRTGEVLINCTSIGMWPDDDFSPMAPDALTGCRVVFDVVYNPLETRLLGDAAAIGATTLNGLDMFIRQAAVQFTLWTSMEPDLALGRACITRALFEHASPS